jgi:glycosyltransferase involved in cell wall biosynthesis
MPNILFGLLYKQVWGARVVVDVDDNELAFRRGGSGSELSLDPSTIGCLPYLDSLAGPKWTNVAVKMVSLFEGVTVSNPVLHRCFGGTVIRHARCEREFDPSRYDQRVVRSKLGLPMDRQIVLFLGTPRPHKGLVETAQALARLGRGDVMMLVVGTFGPDARGVKRKLKAVSGVEIRFLEDQPLSSAPELVAAADVCLALQHPDSDVTNAQVPAKLSDALAMGRPAIVVRNPAFSDLPLEGVALFTDFSDLDKVLERALSQEWQNDERRRKIRQVFLEEFSTSVNARRLQQVVENLPEEDDPRLREYMHRILPHFPGFPVALLDERSTPERKLRGDDLGVAEQRLEEILVYDCPEGLKSALEISDENIAEADKQLAQLEEKPLVSIIMPTYNRAAIISEAIQSVVEQTYPHWELWVCDDASTDATAEVVAQFEDPRIHYLRLEKQGAAAARNRGLELARGEYIAYLDSDNLWRAGFLTRMVWALLSQPGSSCAYADYLDYRVRRDGEIVVDSFWRAPFDHERLLEKNYIDLNSFVHSRELYDCFGGFTESLPRRQDYDLIIKYTWLRDPVYVNDIVALYQRNHSLGQLSVTEKHRNAQVERIVDGNVAGYLADGLPRHGSPVARRVTVISWDMSRNHFSKAFAVAEALSRDFDVQLVSFRFFEEEIFPPLAGAEPDFDTVYLQGSEFPDFFSAMRRALEAIDGDVLYVVKPRLPSLGLALLAQYRSAAPIVLEINDLESVVQSPGRHEVAKALSLETLSPEDDELRNPYSHRWSLVMEGLAEKLPVLATHNRGIDEHFGNRCLYMRNFKDERIYDPERYDRNSIRKELGFSRSDRVILFGGLIRKHKGIYELVELVERLGDPRYKLLFVGSRVSPDQKRLVAEHGDRIKVLPPQDRESMARINLAADLVVLWLDPEVPASHYQMPYKATDALAMGASIIANDISDLGDLARQGYLCLAPFGDWEAVEGEIKRIFSDRKNRREMQAAARRLFLRQFSYPAARAGFEIASRRAMKSLETQRPVAEQFAEFFNDFHQALTGSAEDFVEQQPQEGTGQSDAIQTVSSSDPKPFDGLPESDVVLILACEERGRGLQAARRLLLRAGRDASVLVVVGKANIGNLLERATKELASQYLGVAGDRVMPGTGWLDTACRSLQQSGKGYLGLNAGQASGQPAPFFLVRRAWLGDCIDADAGLLSGAWAVEDLESLARSSGHWRLEPDAVVFDLSETLRYCASSSDKSHLDARFPASRLRRWLPWLGPKAPAESAESEARTGSWDIVIAHASDINRISWKDPEGVAVVMPAIDRDRAEATARLLRDRAGRPVRIFVVLDTRRQGFVKTLNRAARRLKVRYLVYTAEDAVAGHDWLQRAWERLEENGKGLLAFNCGKWRGRIASFGMVRMSWVRSVYRNEVLYSGYRAHRADNELTAIARATDKFIYCPEAVLMENDPGKLELHKGGEQSHPADRRLFRKRYETGFGGLAPKPVLDALADEYIHPDRARLAPGIARSR